MFAVADNLISVGLIFLMLMLQSFTCPTFSDVTLNFALVEMQLFLLFTLWLRWLSVKNKYANNYKGACVNHG